MVDDGVREKIENGLYRVLSSEEIDCSSDGRELYIDSLEAIAIIMGLEEVFGIDIPYEDVDRVFGRSVLGKNVTVAVDSIVAYFADGYSLFE